MPLNLDRLEDKQAAGKGITARCPACAEAGGDKHGERHLIVFADGRFACVAHPGDRLHRSRIWELTGCTTPPMPIIRPLSIPRRAPIWVSGTGGTGDLQSRARARESSFYDGGICTRTGELASQASQGDLTNE